MAVKAEKRGKELELELVGVVGDGWSDEPITAKAVSKALRDAGPVAQINVSLSSVGGYIDEGLQIYQMLADHAAHVVVTVGAQALSCGSLIAMAGDEIVLHATSMFLVHNPWSLAIGDYQEMEKRGADLKMMAGVFANAYASRTGKPVGEMQSLMDEDRYMDAEEAHALGFCTKVLPSKKKPDDSTKKLASLAFESMKTEAKRRLETAAAKALHPTTIPEPSAPEKGDHPMVIALAILSSLCLAEGSTDSDVVSEISKLKASKASGETLLAAIGAKSTDEALGTLKGLRESAEAGAKATAELATIRETTAKDKHAGIVAKASLPASSHNPDPSNPHAGKLTPAMKGWAESVSTETLEGFLAAAPVVLVADKCVKQVAHGKPNVAYSGKAYADMSNTERHELSVSDPELFEELREQHAVSSK
jgi:ATP-dependent Clp protease, protease subunit